MKKTILVLLLALLMAATLITGACASSAPTTMDFAAFLKAVADANYNYDGKGVTVQWSPSSACTNNITHTCPVDGRAPDGNNAQRIQKPNAQYQIFSGETDVSISNVNFKFVPGNFTLCMNNSGWSGTATAEDTPNAELQLKNTGNVTFKNCTFDKVIASPFSSTTTTTFESCKFSNVYNAYAIKDVYSPTLIVNGCTFENCGGAIYLESDTKDANRSFKTSITITGNTFKNIDKNAAPDKVGTRGLIQFSANGDYSNASIEISGNSSNNDAAVLRQLNPTVTAALVDAEKILAENSFDSSASFFLGTTGVAENTNVYVDATNGNDSSGDGTENKPYKTISAAMAKAKAGDTIMVSGTIGHNFFNGITKPVTVKGNGEEKVNVSGGVALPMVNGTVKFENFSFNGSSTIGVYGSDSGYAGLDLVIEDCDFTNAAGNCVYIMPKINSLTVTNCSFTAPASQTAYGKQYLIWPYYAKTVTVTGCTFDGRNVTRAAIHLGEGHPDGTTATVSGNTFSNFERGVQLAFTNDAPNNVTITNNVFNSIALSDKTISESYEVATVFIHENLKSNTKVSYTENELTGTSERAIYTENAKLDISSVVTEFSGNTINSVDLGGLSENVFDAFVAEVNGTKYKSIAAAIAAANDGDTVTILPGTHALAADKCIIVNKRLTIRGSGEDTVISGSGVIDYGNGLFTFTAGSEGSVLEDLTLRYISTGTQRAAIYFDGGFTGGSADNVTKICNVHIIGGDSLASISTSIGISSTYMTGGFIEVSGCTLENLAYGMYFNGVHDLTISGNTIDGTKYNAINIAGDSDEYGCYDVSISGNTLRNISYANYSDPVYSSGISVGTNATVEIGQNDISMLNGKESVYFVPDDTPGTRYIVSVVVDGVTIRQAAVKDGGSFTLPSAPTKPGYIFMGWKYGDATYQAGEKFTVTGDMTFTAVWANMPDITPGTPDAPDVEPDALPFTDVHEGQWFYEAVKYVYGAGIMNGMDRYTFAPNGTLTRAMVWTMLARLDGVDTEGGATWYARAQAWAMDKGVSDGTEPMGNITREQLVTMLYRFAEMNGADMTQGGMGIREYEDYAEISDWALTAMAWAVNNGIIEGDAGALKPTSTCTRAEAAAMFMRSCNNIL